MHEWNQCSAPWAVFLFAGLVLTGCSDSRTARTASLSPDYARGRHIYNTFCAPCHDTGKNDAPTLDDVDEWDTRSLGLQSVLPGHVSKGFLTMPAKGGHAGLTDRNLTDAVYYMVREIAREEEE